MVHGHILHGDIVRGILTRGITEAGTIRGTMAATQDSGASARGTDGILIMQDGMVHGMTLIGDITSDPATSRVTTTEARAIVLTMTISHASIPVRDTAPVPTEYLQATGRSEEEVP